MYLLRLGIGCFSICLTLCCLVGMLRSCQLNWNHQGNVQRSHDIMETCILCVPTVAILFVLFRGDTLMKFAGVIVIIIVGVIIWIIGYVIIHESFLALSRKKKDSAPQIVIEPMQ